MGWPPGRSSRIFTSTSFRVRSATAVHSGTAVLIRRAKSPRLRKKSGTHIVELDHGMHDSAHSPIPLFERSDHGKDRDPRRVHVAVPIRRRGRESLDAMRILAAAR